MRIFVKGFYKSAVTDTNFYCRERRWRDETLDGAGLAARTLVESAHPAGEREAVEWAEFPGGV